MYIYIYIFIYKLIYIYIYWGGGGGKGVTWVFSRNCWLICLLEKGFYRFVLPAFFSQIGCSFRIGWMIEMSMFDLHI